MAESWESLDWYDTPRYYDVLFGPETRQEGAFLEAVARRYGRSRGKRALEPACGSGRLVEELARRGWRVTGFDGNPAMLDFARERLRARGLRARVFEGKLESFDAGGAFDLAHCLVSTFKYVQDERGARSHLRSVARALAPGGVYVLGFHLTDYAATRRNRERWDVSRRGLRVVCNIQAWPADRRTRLERIRSRLRVIEAGREKRLETEWRFRSYDAREVRSLLSAVPELEHVATYDFHYAIDEPAELADGSFDVVLVLRRRESRERAPGKRRRP